MGFSDIIVIAILTYYSIYVAKILVSKTKRDNIQKTNIEMDVIRKKPVKTVEEQKQFLNLKYPKTGKFKWSWKVIPTIIISMIIYVIVFQLYRYAWNITGMSIKFWQALLFIILFPMILNIVLEKFNIQKGDLRYMLRW